MIKLFIHNFKGYQKEAILSPTLVLMEVLMEVLLPFMMVKVIDVGLANADIGYIVNIGLIMLVMMAFSLSFGYLGGKFAAIASAGLSKNLRKSMYDNIQEFSFSNIDRFSTSSLVTRLTTDVTNVQNAAQMVLRMMVRAPMMIVFATIMTYTINPRMSLIFLFAIPFFGILLYVVMMKAHPNFKKMFKRYDLVNRVIQENLTGIRTVKSFVREEYEEEKFKDSTNQLYDFSKRAEKIIILNNPIMQFTMYSCMLLLSWFGAKFIITGAMTTGEFMSLFMYMSQILMSLMMLSMVFVMIVMAKSSAERITEVLQEKSDLVNPSTPITSVENGSVTFSNVGFSYVNDDANLTLSDLSFTINSGETIGIIGETGSAKTTLAQLIPRLYDVTHGQVSVGGIDVREYDIETLRNEVAVVLQKNVLFSGTIRDNLKWGNEHATDEEIIRVCKLAQAHDFIQSFPEQYDTYIEQGGVNVSGGQKQRLCIARALLKQPKILILDDSTSAVDTKTDQSIRKAFREEIPATTKIIIAQRISSIEDADKILVLNEGKLNGFGTHSELLKSNEIYRDVYQSQMKGGISDVN